jgi:choline dehydrogenase-like flavoprotein
MNAMVYIRGNRADFDEWAAMGAERWGYDDVLPYFKRSEDNERGEDAFHGAGGPMSVSDSRAMRQQFFLAEVDVTDTRGGLMIETCPAMPSGMLVTQARRCGRVRLRRTMSAQMLTCAAV